MYSKDKIKFMALAELGRVDKPDFMTSQDKDVLFINSQYEHIVNHVLQSYSWGWSRKYAQLTERTDCLPTEGRYKYNFKLPVDFLYLSNKYKTPSFSVKIEEFDLDYINKQINTDAEECYIEYTRNTAEENYPHYFVEYLKLKLAFDVCYHVTGDTDLLKILDQRVNAALIRARNVDARQQRIKVIEDSPYIDVRG